MFARRILHKQNFLLSFAGVSSLLTLGNMELLSMFGAADFHSRTKSLELLSR